MLPTPAMRKILLATLPLLLTACVDDSASYYVGGRGSSHALTVKREQEHLWKRDAAVSLILSRLPDCQRRITLGSMPAKEVEIELFGLGEQGWILRDGNQLWQVETQTCTELPEPKKEAGDLLGVFRVEGGKLVFVPAVLSPDGAPGAAADGQPEAQADEGQAAAEPGAAGGGAPASGKAAQ
ncbi:hypothetical protein [Rugamonas apoptosis]|uniref:Lipoprotein n=1 Tax=Rugamonas apoptosis TaxID=2758570 RepID=A0A7W2F6Q2_9BURK|nr:hypothetical protein [Rugamonas apoptosis]MBA5686111.1 hypothetical protein [Rugamonas apoptosis]